MSPLEQAQALIDRDPHDPDIEEKIEALRQQADPEDRPLFDDLYEALMIAQQRP